MAPPLTTDARDVAATFAGPTIDPEVQYAHLLDVPLRVEAVLDIVPTSAAQLTSLQPGSVLRLTKPAGAMLDFYVDRTRLAAGEIAVIEDGISVRIIELP